MRPIRLQTRPSVACGKRTRDPRMIPGGTALLLALSLMAVGVGCSPVASIPDDALAVVEGQVVRTSDFHHRWTERTPGSDSPEHRREVLEQVIERSALAAAARDAGLLNDPAVLEGLENLLLSRLRATRLAPQVDAIQITEAEIQAEYESQREIRYRQPERTRVAVLWFSTRGLAPLIDRYRPRLEAARVASASIPAADGFGPLAIRNTEHSASRYQGGDIGWIESGAANSPWHQTVLEVAADLKEPGDLSPVIAGEKGLFLVRLIERQAASVRPLESVRAGIEQRLRSQRRRDLEEAFRRDILEAATVQRFPDRLLALGDLPVRKEEQEPSGPSAGPRLSANP